MDAHELGEPPTGDLGGSLAEPCVRYSEAGERPARLEIRRPDGTSRALAYGSLDYVAYDGRKSAVVLVFAHCRVVLGGINLWPLYQALLEDGVKAIIVRDDLHELPSRNVTVIDSCRVETGADGPVAEGDGHSASGAV